MAPDPKPRRHGRRPRKGVEPKGLRRWRLSQRHKADPRPTRRHRKYKLAYTGGRGGRYWQGPHKRRYDPPQKRRHFGSVRKYGSKVEGSLSRYGIWLGLAAALGIGAKTGIDRYITVYGDDGMNRYTQRITGADGGIPEAFHTFQYDTKWYIMDKEGNKRYMSPLDYMAYKFLGYNMQGKFGEPSVWVVPFWASLVAYIAGKLLKRSGKGSLARIGRIVEPIGKGALIGSAIGALVLPGCPDALGKGEYGAGTNNMNAGKPPRGAMLPSPPQNPQYASAY